MSAADDRIGLQVSTTQFQKETCCHFCGRPLEIKSDDLDCSFVGRDLWINGHVINLTIRQMQAFKLLAKAYPFPHSRERMFSAIWSPATDEKIIDVVMCAIRKKLKVAGIDVHNVRGVGFQLTHLNA